MVDSRLMGEFEADVKELEADSWSITVDKKCLKHLKKDIVKRQDVIYGKSMLELNTFLFSLWPKAFAVLSFCLQTLTK